MLKRGVAGRHTEAGGGVCRSIRKSSLLMNDDNEYRLALERSAGLWSSSMDSLNYVIIYSLPLRTSVRGAGKRVRGENGCTSPCTSS